jgi:diaminohydroxyphosphoribosylaminopyrimidine deaminase / 5-amino-6-(5-phosphoribosylamino)uracil reductase
MASDVEAAAMAHALAISAAVAGSTNPNPGVGAVVVSMSGEVVGEAVTGPVGGDHAEIGALRAAGERARGATLVVTLEPCAHHGRTPPCADAIVAAGVARVVYALDDPHEIAAGGAARLRAAGVAVESGVGAESARAVLGPWCLAVRRKRPHVTWKYAASLDGRTAATDGTSRWITGTEARADAHRERARADAVVVGIGTVLADDPALTVRDRPMLRQPMRVVVDGAARTPPSALVLDDAAASVVAVRQDAPSARVARLQEQGVDVVRLPSRDGGVDLSALLGELLGREVCLVLVEGGATLAASFVRDRLVDRVVGYHAPQLLGGGPPVIGDFGVATIGEALKLRLVGITSLGDDVRLVAEVPHHTEVGEDTLARPDTAGVKA